MDVYCEVAKGNATLVSSIYHYSTRMIFIIHPKMSGEERSYLTEVSGCTKTLFFYFWIWMTSQRANHVRHTETPPTC